MSEERVKIVARNDDLITRLGRIERFLSPFRCLCGRWFDTIREAACEIEWIDAYMDLRWRADMRAIRRWQAAHPGNDLVHPDHADLCVWLMDELDRLRKERAE